MNVMEKCIICVKQDYNLINISETDSNNVKWSFKLSSCVPEVEWREEYQICSNCRIQLEAVCAFRDSCLRSLAQQLRQYDSMKQTLWYCGHKCYEHKVNFNNQHNIEIPSCDLIYANLKATTNLTHKQEEDERKSSIIPSVDSYKHTNLSPLRNDIYKYKKNTQNDFACFHCNKQFSRKLLLIGHIRTEHQIKKEICNFCHSFHTKEECEKSLTLKECSKLFTTENVINILTNKNCNGMKIKAEQPTKRIKGITSNIKKEIPKRGRKKLEAVSNTCNICGMNFNTRYLAKRHIRNVHATEKNYQCEICQQKFASPVYLNAHKRYHSGERPHICSFCGKGFITGSDLYHHEKIHANKRAYKCDKCPKAFNTSSDLHKHKLCVHQDRSEWKYVCTYCNRRFPLKTNLDAHTKTHTGERNFACHLCNHKCVNRSVLLRHIMSHSNVRLFKCNLCSMEYKYQKSLDIHMTKAHGIGDAKIPERVKKYFCHICPKSYFANNKLQKHIRTHTGERPFSCHICEKRFIDKSYIKQHLKTAHNIISNEIDFV